MKQERNFISQCGASLIEVILSITLVLVLVPFMYFQIADMNNSAKDIARAKQIVKTQDAVVNFMRVNYMRFDNNVPTQLTDNEIAEIAPMASYGFLTKTSTDNTVSIEVLLEFKPEKLGNISGYRIASIAKYIGNDAAIVHDDKTAYSQFWAIQNDTFHPGNLVYRITHDFSTGDTRRYLHRSIAGENEQDLHLNQMQRDLYMNNKNMDNVGNMDVLNLDVGTGTVYRSLFATNGITAGDVNFERGASIKLDGSAAGFSGALEVFGDASAGTLNARSLLVGNTYVSNSVTVNDTFTIKNGKLYLGKDADGNVPDVNPVKYAMFSGTVAGAHSFNILGVFDILGTLTSVEGIKVKGNVVSFGGNIFDPTGLAKFNALKIKYRDEWFEIIDINGNCPFISLPNTETGWIGNIFDYN